MILWFAFGVWLAFSPYPGRFLAWVYKCNKEEIDGWFN